MNAGLILKVRSLQSYKRISHGRRKDSQEFKWIVSIVTSYACSTKQKTISLGDPALSLDMNATLSNISTPFFHPFVLVMPG